MDFFGVTGAGVNDPNKAQRAVSRQGNVSRPWNVHPSVRRPTTAPAPPSQASGVRSRVNRLKNLNVNMAASSTVPSEPLPKATSATTQPVSHGIVELTTPKRLLPPVQSLTGVENSDQQQPAQHEAEVCSTIENKKNHLYSPFGQPLRLLRETWSVQNRLKAPTTAAGAKKVKRRLKKAKPAEPAPETPSETPKAIAALEAFHSQIKSAQTVLDKYASFMKAKDNDKNDQETSDSDQASVKTPLTSPIIRGALVLNRRHVLKISGNPEKKSLNTFEQQMTQSETESTVDTESDSFRSERTAREAIDSNTASVVSATQLASLGRDAQSTKENSTNDDDDEKDWEDIEGEDPSPSSKSITSGLLSKRARRKSWMRSANMRKSSESIKNTTNSGSRAWLNAEHMTLSSGSLAAHSTTSRRTSTSSYRSWLHSDHMRMSTESMKSGTDEPAAHSNRSLKAWLNSGNMRTSAESVYDRRSWLQSGAMRSSTQSIESNTGRMPTNAHRSRRSSRVYGSRFTVVVAQDQPQEQPTEAKPAPSPDPDLTLIALEEQRKRDAIMAKRKEKVSQRRGSIMLTALKSEIRQELRKEFPKKPPPLGMMHLYFNQACKEGADKVRAGLIE